MIMSRRDNDASPGLEDNAMFLEMHLDQKAYYRLRCLEVAVKTFDPDSTIDTRVLFDVAQVLMQYIETGKTPL
jgi:hypothetical protein